MASDREKEIDEEIAKLEKQIEELRKEREGIIATRKMVRKLIGEDDPLPR